MCLSKGRSLRMICVSRQTEAACGINAGRFSLSNHNNFNSVRNYFAVNETSFSVMGILFDAFVVKIYAIAVTKLNPAPKATTML